MKIARLLTRLFPPVLACACGSLATLLFIRLGVAHAAAHLADTVVQPAPVASATDWTQILVAIGTAVSLVLHALLPRIGGKVVREVSDDLDAMLKWWRDRSTPPAAAPPTVAVTATKGPGTAAMLAVLLLGAGLVVAPTGCAGSTQASRTATLTSLDNGWVTAAAALRSYEHEHVQGIIDQAKAHTITPEQASTQVAAFRAKADKTWLALDAAHAAIDAANTVNDDTSIPGARTALDNALTAIAALTGGNAP